mgnify:CR=1 FL=1
MFDKLYLWLFSEKERTPISFIAVFFLVIIISLVISLTVVAVDRHLQGWVDYMWN